MATLSEMIARLKSLDPTTIAKEIVEGDQWVLEDLQEGQLWSGLDSEGNQLAPSYLTDPYFNTREAAERYRDWKERITPTTSIHEAYPDRNRDTPNLYINGYWYSGIKLDLNGLGFFINDNALNPEIEAKYPKALGLNSIGTGWYIREKFRKKFITQVKKELLNAEI